MEHLKTVGTDGIRLLLAKLDDLEAAPRSLKQSFRRMSRSCAGSGSNGTSRSKEGSGYSTQKRCLKSSAASNPSTKRRPATLHQRRYERVGYKVHPTEKSYDEEDSPNLITSVRTTVATAATDVK